MNIDSCSTVHQNSGRQFGFFRLSKSKEAVDASPNTLRKYHAEEGLPFYQKKGERAVWVRFDEVEALLRQRIVKKQPAVQAQFGQSTDPQS